LEIRTNGLIISEFTMLIAEVFCYNSPSATELTHVKKLKELFNSVDIVNDPQIFEGWSNVSQPKTEFGYLVT
jgi:hypothetical protein